MIQSSKIIFCPKCNHQMPRYTGARSMYFSCGKCRTYFSDIGHVIRVEGDFVKNVSSEIPIGAVGVFDKREYVVVGLLVGKETGTTYTWNEYVLYNQDYGYISLSNYNGHWSLVKSISNPTQKVSVFSYEGKTYDLFSKYYMFYAAAEGEFNWQLINKDDTQVMEYIAPPYSIIREENKRKVEWHKAKYLSGSEIKLAFKGSVEIKTTKPRPLDIFSNQPNIFANMADWSWKYALAFVFCLALLIVLKTIVTPSPQVFNETVFLDTLSGQKDVYKTYVTNNFVLKSPMGHSSLRVNMEAPADNSWLEAEVNLINQSTDDEYNLELGVEYYHGYDGGSWSEGSTSTDKILSMVPDGTYKLSITPHTESIVDSSYQSVPKVNFLNLSIDQNTSITSNYILVILAAIAIPAIVILGKKIIEYNRWQKSDYGY